MLKAVPKNWFSSVYKVMDNGALVAILDPSLMREAADLIINGVTYRAYRENLLTGAFLFELDGAILGRAVKPSAMYRSFQVDCEGNQYTLEAESVWTRKFVLMQGGMRVGSVYPEHALTRSAIIDFPESISLPGRVFLFWLVMIMWKRATDAAAAS